MSEVVMYSSDEPTIVESAELNSAIEQRNKLSHRKKFRALTSSEIERLVKNSNTASQWDSVQVSDNFDPSLVRNCHFAGLVRIGDLTPNYLDFHKLRLPVGLDNCTIISCDIGDNVAMRNVHYLSHYVIGSQCILFNIDEMHTVDNAKFGNGIIREGEKEEVRVWLEVANENGGRKILPFQDMLPADAYLWSGFRNDKTVTQKFKEFTDNMFDHDYFTLGYVRDKTVIKNTRIIKDCYIGEHAYIKGANKLKNLTIQSSKNEATQIGEGVELVNGIIGYANKIFYGVKAIRFQTGRNVQLKYGARLINSFLGDNSTISCCELLSNIIFPFHEQHHNNSFLIASTVMGQSNIAAGATIGSNHNSRAADGEIIARRGFWPGLETNFKHNSLFASFTIIAKGNYNTEMNITLPFSLVSVKNDDNAIQIYPGYWFKNNMYALARNVWKFKKRDKRHIKEQHIEFDFLAPDTVEEMLRGSNILFDIIKNTYNFHGKINELAESELVDKKNYLEIDGVIHGNKAYVYKPLQGIRLYRKMIRFYGIRELVNLFLNNNTKIDLKELKNNFIEPQRKWHNIGGQLINDHDLTALFKDIKTGHIDSWKSLHQRYNDIEKSYPSLRAGHGIFCLLKTEDKSINDITVSDIKLYLQEGKQTALELYESAYASRKKDYTNPFRIMTYHSEEEMENVLGNIDDNSFLKDYKAEMLRLSEQCDNLLDIID